MPSENLTEIIRELMQLMEEQNRIFSPEAVKSLSNSQLEQYKQRYTRIQELTAELGLLG